MKHLQECEENVLIDFLGERDFVRLVVVRTRRSFSREKYSGVALLLPFVPPHHIASPSFVPSLYTQFSSSRTRERNGQTVAKVSPFLASTSFEKGLK